MKITYTPNPLNTIVELDEFEKKELWYKIKIAEMTEMLGMAEVYLLDKNIDIERAIKEVDSSYYDIDDENGKSKLDKRCDTLLEYYIAELQSSHAGDCTCIPSSCLKCHAEALLGISTTSGLGKYGGNKIQSAFTRKNGDTYEKVTLDEALEKLSIFKINPKDYDTENWKKIGGYEQYVPRWKAEQESAYQWLLNYKNTHFKDSHEK